MANFLLAPILQDGIRSSNFFNGRLLSAEDLSLEQTASLGWRKRLGKAIGEGIAYGLEVAEASGESTKESPVVTIQPGLALNRSGQPLKLATKTNVVLVRPEEVDALSTGQSAFGDCKPLQPTVYIAGAGIYVFTIGPAKGTEGRAPVSGLRNETASCNVRYQIDGVQFRLIQLTFSAAELSKVNLLRSLAAQKCFGTDTLATSAGNPFGAPLTTYGALDDLRPDSLTPCEVPLALLYWTTSGGIEFIDLWSVRRRLIDPASAQRWGILAGDRRVGEAEAMFLQFQDQLDTLWRSTSTGGVPKADLIAADQYFVSLPPVGYLLSGTNGFNWRKFLGPLAPPAETLLDEGLLRSVVHGGFFEDAVRISSFSEWAKASTVPPDPMQVYRIPGNNKFVVFARSVHGRLRVFLSPAPTFGETVEIHATCSATDTEWRSTAGNEGAHIIDDLPSRSYQVDIAVQNYKSVSPKTAVVVDGRTTDLSVTIERLPYGSLLLTIVDEDGQSIGSKVSSVSAVSQQGSVSTTGKLTSNDRWLVSDLPPYDYTITVIAPNYRTTTVSGVRVSLGQQVQKTIALVRTTVKRPPLCILIEGLKKPVLAKARICMIIGCVKSTGSKDETNIFAFSEDDLGYGKASKKEEKAKEIFEADESTWKDMVQVESLPSDVQQWLADWKEFFANEYPSAGIGNSKPMIFMNPHYAPPRSTQEVPSKPQAYALFGKLAVPLSITPSKNLTKRPVKVGKAKVPGIGEDVLDMLKRCGIIYIDQLPGLWSDYLERVIDKSPDYCRHLIIDSIKAIEKILKDLLYYDDMTPELDEGLKKMGWNDDVAIANASREKLADLEEVVDLGFAIRLIEEAREIVPIDTWSLEYLGFTEGQIEILEGQGIRSKGEFILVAEDMTKVGEIADSLSIDKESVGEFRTTAIGQMAADSIKQVRTEEITALSGVNAIVAEKMAAADIHTVEELSTKSAAEVAKAANVSEEAAASMIETAKAASRGAMEVSVLAPISTEEAASLRSGGITSISELASKTVTEIAGFMGNDVGKARAIIDASRATLGMGIKG